MRLASADILTSPVFSLLGIGDWDRRWAEGEST
jgi:hypothetical protein